MSWKFVYRKSRDLSQQGHFMNAYFFFFDIQGKILTFVRIGKDVGLDMDKMKF